MPYKSSPVVSILQAMASYCSSSFVIILLYLLLADPDIPGDLLEAILSTQLPLDLAATLVGDVNSDTLHSSVHDYLATLLEVHKLVTKLKLQHCSYFISFDYYSDSSLSNL